MEVPDHLTSLLRNLYEGQEATVRTGHGTMYRFRIGKGSFKAVYGHPAYFIICRVHHQNAELDESQAGIKIAVRSINNLGHVDDTTLMSESQEELKSLLKKVKKESKKAGLKFNIQKTKIMAFCPITSWQIDGETMEQLQTLFWGPPRSLQMVTTDMKLKDACSLEGKL